jgi:hypothetical protein
VRSYDPFPGLSEEVEDDGSCAQTEGEHLCDVEFVIPAETLGSVPQPVEGLGLPRLLKPMSQWCCGAIGIILKASFMSRLSMMQLRPALRTIDRAFSKNIYLKCTIEMA